MHGFETPEELMLIPSQILQTISMSIPSVEKDFIELTEAEQDYRNYEIQARTRDGSIKYLSVNALTVKDENGKTLSAMKASYRILQR